MKKEKHPELSQICSYGIFSKGLKNEFETAVVNEPSVFEQLKFYCILKRAIKTIPRMKNKEKKERNSVCGKHAEGIVLLLKFCQNLICIVILFVFIGQYA